MFPDLLGNPVLVGRPRWEDIDPHILAPHHAPEFVIRRDIPGAGQMTEEQIRDVSLNRWVLRGIGPRIGGCTAASPMIASPATFSIRSLRGSARSRR